MQHDIFWPPPQIRLNFFSKNIVVKGGEGVVQKSSSVGGVDYPTHFNNVSIWIFI